MEREPINFVRRFADKLPIPEFYRHWGDYNPRAMGTKAFFDSLRNTSIVLACLDFTHSEISYGLMKVGVGLLPALASWVTAREMLSRVQEETYLSGKDIPR